MKDIKPSVNQKTAAEYLKFFYPKLRGEISELSLKDNFAGIIQTTVNYLRNLLMESKINIIAYHMKLMDMIYKKSDDYVKDVIENIFVRSFSSFRKHGTIQQWKILYQNMPVSFQLIYNEQRKQDKIFFGK
ncbi:hypothetical protein ASG31_17390 [Chryseobacterium sp. Leaf404]|uniref:DUF7674 family protein n=1 Tax=unclassified Chryseobacterium TaxID=2593645 RepID=UPI0007022CE6|nr:MULTISPECIES: hypothetical protein [unclassified Chryseobacterium]KQT20541.1 hypothetical protein ASG31_17390 [Chryseobacterium sp. Leaf404]